MSTAKSLCGCLSMCLSIQIAVTMQCWRLVAGIRLTHSNKIYGNLHCLAGLCWCAGECPVACTAGAAGQMELRHTIVLVTHAGEHMRGSV
jgi:hypothetical protein